MKITRITIHRLPGIERPFRIERIAPGLNIILGPNASGKSSLCRVIRQTLRPGNPPSRTRARITWADGKKIFISELEGRVTWQRDGEDLPSPEVPPGYLARCYTLNLHDLLEDKNPGDHKLAEEIKVKMAGGYDLPAVEDLFRLKTNHARSEVKLLSEAEAEFSRLQNERRGLAEEEDRLGSLEKEREESRAAAQEMIALANAGELAKKREEVNALRPFLA